MIGWKVSHFFILIPYSNFCYRNQYLDYSMLDKLSLYTLFQKCPVHKLKRLLHCNTTISIKVKLYVYTKPFAFPTGILVWILEEFWCHLLQNLKFLKWRTADNSVKVKSVKVSRISSFYGYLLVFFNRFIEYGRPFG